MSLIIFNIILFLILVIIKLGVFLGLVKIFNKESKIAKIIKGFFIYEAIMFVLTWIYYPSSILIGSKIGFIRPISFLIVSCVVFLIIARKLELLTWARGVIVFLLMIIIISPILGFYVTQIMTNLLGDNITSGLGIEAYFRQSIPTKIVGQLIKSVEVSGLVMDYRILPIGRNW